MTDVNIAITTGIGADTYFRSTVPNGNYGTAVVLAFINGVRKGLLRFDLSGIPSTAICTAAVLKFYANSIGANTVFDVYKITDANGDWVEGTYDAGGAENGSPCWNKKKYNTVDWAGSAGLQTAGTDYVNTVIATGSAASGIASGTLISITFNAAGLAVLQDWFGDATNNGLLVVTDVSNTISVHSGEATTEAYRPVLAISYTEATTGGTEVLNANIFESEILNSRIVR